MLPEPTVAVVASDAVRLGLVQGDDGIYRLPRPKTDELIDRSLPGFKNGFVSSWAIAARIDTGGFYMPRNKIKSFLKSKGYVIAGRARRALPEEGGVRPMIYVAENVVVSDDLTDAYCRAQGYLWSCRDSQCVLGSGRQT